MNPKRAGMIPFIMKDGKVEMMFMVPSDPAYGGDKLQIAKGGIDAGESAQQSALREAGEELGLRKNNIRNITDIGIYLHMQVYLVQVKNQAAFNKPHFETGAVQWLTANQFWNDGRQLHRFIVQHAAKVARTIISNEKDN